MEPTPLLIFDDGLGDFGPLTDLRPAFALRNGVVNNRRRIETSLGQMAAALVVSDALVEILRQRETDAVVNPTSIEQLPASLMTKAEGGPWESSVRAERCALLCVNGRWTGHDDASREHIAALEPGQAVVTADGGTVAVLLGPDDADAVLSQPLHNGLNATTQSATSCDAALLARPWDLLDQLDATLGHDLCHTDLPRCDTPPPGVTVIGEHPLRLHPTATLLPQVVIDTTLGPVALDAGAHVLPFCVIEGPAYLGRNAELAAHTALRSTTAVGDGGKLGGEVKASIVGDFTNKAHHGYLGNAIVGDWCNLGAGTTVSNLKNTYGEVRAKLDADREAEATGRQFQGPIVGDFVRTAIGTLLPTGACVGTGSCLVSSAFVPKHVPAMTFLTDAGPRPMDPEAFFATARRMMGRRDTALSDAEQSRLQSLMH